MSKTSDELIAAYDYVVGGHDEPNCIVFMSHKGPVIVTKNGASLIGRPIRMKEANRLFKKLCTPLK